MSGNRILPHLLSALALAAVIYGGGFWLDHHLRTRRGPWAIEFTRTPDDSPMIVIHQPSLGIRDIRVLFPGEVAAKPSATIRFGTPEQAVPWGRVKYEDLTYLPGVVTLELFGHEIEMLPRTMYVNRQSVPWLSATNITLTAADRPAALPEPNAARRNARQPVSENKP
jgi:hypothetical protein